MIFRKTGRHIRNIARKDRYIDRKIDKDWEREAQARREGERDRERERKRETEREAERQQRERKRERGGGGREINIIVLKLMLPFYTHQLTPPDPALFPQYSDHLPTGSEVNPPSSTRSPCILNWCS